MASLPTLSSGGRITAATSSQICDGAAAILICNDTGLRKLNLKPRARIVALDLAGDDPVAMLSAPIPATKKVLKRAGLSLQDMEIYEVCHITTFHVHTCHSLIPLLLYLLFGLV